MYVCVFHIRKQPERRLSEVKIEVEKSGHLQSIISYGVWVDKDYKFNMDSDLDVYLLPASRLQYIEKVED